MRHKRPLREILLARQVGAHTRTVQAKVEGEGTYVDIVDLASTAIYVYIYNMYVLLDQQWQGYMYISVNCGQAYYRAQGHSSLSSQGFL